MDGVRRAARAVTSLDRPLGEEGGETLGSLIPAGEEADAFEEVHVSLLGAALRAAAGAASYGAGAALEAARAELASVPAVDLDYLDLVLPDLSPLPDDVAPGTEARALVAARVGSTRLIDNLPLTLGRP